VSREVAILNLLKPHNHIVELLDVPKENALVFEMLSCTLLEEIDQRETIPLEKATKWVYQMLRACEHMHSKGIVHRDIKPENVLLSKNAVLKICDFGSAK